MPTKCLLKSLSAVSSSIVTQCVSFLPLIECIIIVTLKNDLDIVFIIIIASYTGTEGDLGIKCHSNGCTL